ncbi:MAG: glutamate racemase, partial [Psychroserpens sp.]|nr:glutamate racemase [Psychroserpens sp.]
AILEQREVLNSSSEAPMNQFYSNADVSVLTDIVDAQFPVAYLNF